ncbi:MAG TPA: sugar ABC transporter substrate-binding protein [Limnochordia bacterium]
MYPRYPRRSFIAAAAVAAMVLAAALPVAALAQAADEPVVIRYGHWLTSETMVAATNRIIDEFEASHPGIEVEFVPVQWGGEQAYLEQITTWVIGGAAPDVMNISYALLPQLAEQGAILPVDAYLARDAREVAPDDFVPIALEATSWNGHQYGLPFELGLWWVNYNEDAFAEAGLQTPASLYRTGGWNWDAMIESARKITHRNADGVVDRWGMWTFPGDAGTYPWLWAFGGRLLSEDGQRAAIGDPGAIEGISFFHRLMYQERILAFPHWMGIPAIATNYDETLTRGAFGMQPWWMSMIGSYAEANVNWSFDQVPIPPGPESPMTVPSHIHTVAIMKGTQHPDAAWEFVKYVTGEGYRRVIEADPAFSVVRRSQFPLWARQYQALDIEGIQFFNEGITRTRLRPRHSRIREIDAMVQQALGAVWRNEAPVASTLEQLARRIDAVLQEP